MILLCVLFIIIYLYLMFYITNMEHIKFMKIIFNIALAIFIGAPVGAILLFILTDVLSNLCILPCDVFTYGLYPFFGAVFGIFLGIIVVLVMRFRHDKYTQIPSYFYEHTQYRKRKNDDKPKNFPSFPRSDKQINDNRS